VLVTDSLPLGEEIAALGDPVRLRPAKIEQLSVAALFARAIEAIHDGTSVFELVN
jgi:phosphoribosylpyrophosphate synthetase